MGSEPARLTEISVQWAEISFKRDENFPYKHMKQAGPVKWDDFTWSTHVPIDFFEIIFSKMADVTETVEQQQNESKAKYKEKTSKKNSKQFRWTLSI